MLDQVRGEDHVESPARERHDIIEGAAKDSTLIAILEFPTREALDSFASDPDYAPYGKARQSGSVSNFHVIDDTDIAGAFPYRKAG